MTFMTVGYLCGPFRESCFQVFLNRSNICHSCGDLQAALRAQGYLLLQLSLASDPFQPAFVTCEECPASECQREYKTQLGAPHPQHAFRVTHVTAEKN